MRTTSNEYKTVSSTDLALALGMTASAVGMFSSLFIDEKVYGGLILGSSILTYLACDLQLMKDKSKRYK